MTKSKFMAGLETLSADQFARVQAELNAEAQKRANGWNNLGSMNDQEFAAFSEQATRDAAKSHELGKLQSAAAKHGKTIADAKPAGKATVDEDTAESEGDDAA